METQIRTGKLIFAGPNLEIRIDMGRVYVNGIEVARDKIKKDAIRLAAYLNESGQYRVNTGWKEDDTVTINKAADYRE